MIGYDGDKRSSDDRPIHTEKILADRKIFFLDLKENDRGQFVKITEDVRGRRDTIMVPIEFLDDFIGALEDIREASDLPE
ncbi:MAG: DNA-binding protein [Verrucomicrobiales bacterium]|nr:DNA-binding protein [Verrucomicrobiales bacterium]